MTTDYPTVALEEVETLFDWLQTHHGVTWSDVDGGINMPASAAKRLFESEDSDTQFYMMLFCLNWLYVRVEAFEPQFWPAETKRITWHDMPDWVYALYNRMNALDVA